MKLKIIPKRKSLVIIFLGFIFFLGLILLFTTNTTAFYKKEQSSFGLPVYLKIPKINVNSPIESVGLTSSGAVDVPKGPINAAWFDLWPRPGEKGNSIITGHSGWKNKIPAVFDNLYKLQKGDKLYITDDRGVVISFVVREIKKYDPNADALDVFISKDGKAHLNLITCAGTWNNIKKSHSDRLVVFTEKEIK